MAMVEASSSQRVLFDKAFSVPKSVRLARTSHHSHKLLRNILGAVPVDLREDLSEQKHSSQSSALKTLE